MIVDKRYRTDGRKARVLHVPLTDAEFNRLRDIAHVKRETMGDLTGLALRAALTLSHPITPKEPK